jgi:hypothetical protein
MSLSDNAAQHTSDGDRISARGRGATFTIEIPAPEAFPEPTPPTHEVAIA